MPVSATRHTDSERSVGQGIHADRPMFLAQDELAPNLPIELDFVHEAQNAEACRAMFAGDSRILVPEVCHVSGTRTRPMGL